MRTTALFLSMLFLCSINAQSENDCEIKTTLEKYLDKGNKNCKLDYVESVTTKDGIMTVKGLQNDDFTAIKITLGTGQVFAVSETGWLFSKKYARPLPISLTTVPFKVRPKSENLHSSAESGLTNLGLNFEIFNINYDRYFRNGTKSNHKFSIGALVAPMVQEMDSVNTSGFLGKSEKKKQFFVSTGLTLTYSYNSIAFTLVPIGFDFSTGSIGKQWDYDKKWWIGFGIGIEPKIFSMLSAADK